MHKHNELIVSDDGSHTLISDQFGVSYHSTHGAIQESITVFLAAGLQKTMASYTYPIRILEMGFGTGLNALLTLMESNKYKISVDYTTVEAYPVPIDEVVPLNYIQLLHAPELEGPFHQMHLILSHQPIALTCRFTFRKCIEKIEVHSPTHAYDLIYYDAFAPTTQPELWGEAIMQKMYDLLDTGGILVSYCAKGSFKRACRAAGFEVESLPGPPGKREMTRAIKSL